MFLCLCIFVGVLEIRPKTGTVAPKSKKLTFSDLPAECGYSPNFSFPAGCSRRVKTPVPLPHPCYSQEHFYKWQY